MRKMLKSSWVSKDSTTRLYHLENPIIGLTGGIATGKSTASAYLKSLGFEILDADLLVKEIYATKEAKDFIGKHFPQAIENDTLNFPELRKLFFNDPLNKQKIESFIYLKLPETFKRHAEKMKQNFVIYDVPLLFEKQLNLLCDINICVYTPSDVQIKRLIKRDQISLDLATEILKQQMPIEEKKRLSDFVLDNSPNDERSLSLKKQIDDLVSILFEEY